MSETKDHKWRINKPDENQILDTGDIYHDTFIIDKIIGESLEVPCVTLPDGKIIEDYTLITDYISNISIPDDKEVRAHYYYVRLKTYDVRNKDGN